MVSGIGLSEQEQEFIIKNKEKMFYNQMATILDRSQTAVRKFCQKVDETSDEVRE